MQQSCLLKQFSPRQQLIPKGTVRWPKKPLENRFLHRLMTIHLPDWHQRTIDISNCFIALFIFGITSSLTKHSGYRFYQRGGVDTDLRICGGVENLAPSYMTKWRNDVITEDLCLMVVFRSHSFLLSSVKYDHLFVMIGTMTPLVLSSYIKTFWTPCIRLQLHLESFHSGDRHFMCRPRYWNNKNYLKFQRLHIIW